MAFEYEALVGHLYIVGGRALSVLPPGTLVEVAPKKAARGREGDTFFVLVLPSGDLVGPTTFYEQMAQLAAERYFGSSGSVTAGLRSVFDTINQNLVEHNQSGKRRYEASMLAAVMRGSDLYIGKVGSGVVLLQHAGQLFTFPENLTDDDALYRPPLGVHPVPDVRMTRYTVMAGSRLMMGDAGLADIEREKMTEALSSTDISMMLVAFKEMVTASLRANITAMGAEFVPPEEPVAVAVPVREGESTLEIVATARAAETAVKTEARLANGMGRRRKANREVVERLGKMRERVTQSTGTVALKASETVESVEKVVEHYFPEENEKQKSWLSSPIAAGVAILIPVVVVALVFAMWLGGTGVTVFEECVAQATQTASTARAIASSDVVGTRAAWNAVILQIERCNELRENDPMMMALLRDAQAIIDRLDYVDRREPVVIAAFEGAAISNIVLQGLNLFALDDSENNNLVYRVQLNSDGRSSVSTTGDVIADMRTGASVGGYTVGDIVDIAWAEDAGGSSQGRVIIAVDRTGVLVACPVRFLLQCTAQRLFQPENWVNPVAITVWEGNLYVLDAGANQIWKYEPSGGVYANPPSEYFSGQGRPAFTSAIDFEIDNQGRVYVLLSDGNVMLFLRGENVGFGFSAFPEGQSVSNATGLFLNPNPMAQEMYVTDATARTIYRTSYAGTFFSSYRAYDESLFVSLSSIAVDTDLGMIYVGSGNSVLGISRED